MFMVDMAHFAGLVAGGAHPSPVPHSDFVTLTTHKTMRGPWGGLILCREQYADAIDKAVCPGIQGGPLLHAIAAKAVMFQQCAQPEFRAYAAQVVANAAALARGLMERGCVLTTGGTDNHLMVIDLRPFGLRGRAVQTAFDEIGITLNANAFPGHGGTAFNPNGIRLGTPSVTSRGMGEAEMGEIAEMIHLMLTNFDDAQVRSQVRGRSLDLCRRFPLPYPGRREPRIAWHTAILPFLVASIVCIVAVPASMWLARRIGAVAVPDDERRLHAAPTPQLGGLAMLLGFGVALIIFGGQIQSRWPILSLPRPSPW